jgi:hypothetical protein
MTVTNFPEYPALVLAIGMTVRKYFLGIQALES